MSGEILVQAIEDGAGGLYVAYIVNDTCNAIFSGFEYNAESVMLRELENAYNNGIADWEGAHDGNPEQLYNELITGEAGSAQVIGQMDCDGYLDWPQRMGAAGERWADLKERARFKVVFYQNSTGLPAQVLADSIEGAVTSSVTRFNGEHDIAIIEAPNDSATIALFRELADNDENVLLYEIN